MPDQVIDVSATSEPREIASLAVERRSEVSVGRAMTVDELHERLEFVRQVMRKEMKEGTDYGKIPGTGEKPTLLQPGAQKLLMTFNLTEEVKKEVLREYPDFHREYEFTITVCAGNGKRWDGVGTCSTLESKYRYRRAERTCPNCGKKALIAEKAEYLQAGEQPGWVCWKKKQGCGTRFRKDHPQIEQGDKQTENADPADTWNTVRKMAFKRALVAAAINATNTSELWTQDLEEGANGEPEAKKPPQTRQAPPAATSRPSAAQKPQESKPAQPVTPPNQQSKPAEQPKYPTPETRAHLIRKLQDNGDYDSALDYFRKLEKPAVILPNETLSNIPLEFVPLNRQQWEWLMEKIKWFQDGNPAEHAFPPNPLPEEEKKQRAAKPPAPAKPVEVPRDANLDPNSPEAAWRSFPMPFGKDAGTKLADLDKGTLFGWWANYEVKTTWEGTDGRVHQSKPDKIAKDRKLRQMLDQAGLHYEFAKPSGGDGPEF